MRRNWRGAAGVQVEGERAGNMGDGKEDGTGWGEAGAGEGFYRWHVRAAVVRSVASFALWLSCLGACGIGLVHRHNLIADTLAVSFLILMNPPVLWVLKRLRKRKAAEAFAIVINGLEIVGYTAVIHALGGIEAAYLLIIYAALIVYVGMWGVGYRPFLVAGMCSLFFAALVTLEHTGVLTPLRINPDYVVTWPEQLGIVSVTAPLLFIVAFISAYTARIIHHSGETLRLQKEALEEALRKAQESDRLKAEFLANVSHELRTPLNAILGFSELLKEGVFGPLNEKQEESLGDILDSGRHLLTLVNDLLDLNKVEAGRMELVPSQTNLRGLIQEGLHVFQEKAHERGQSLMADLAECPATLQADERRLRQILYNLLSNALKFTPAGGEIRLSARELAWEEGGWRSAAGRAVVLPIAPGEEGMDQRRIVEIRVADTGIGIKAQDLERIFNPFEQADGSMTRRYEGTGLGLALTRRFVEMHGGRVWAESGGENLGSVFHVVLPL